ncbi:hypothetical protein C8R46DRAFT_1057619, partial [Mycena filopes]
MLLLDQDRARMSVFDAQILELERFGESLPKLRVARDTVQARLDAFKYPVLSLPNEVVCEIFTQFLPTYPLRPPLVGPESPTLLTQICHLWREIAIGMPTLWRAIELSRYFPSISRQAGSLSVPLSMRIGSWDTSLTLAELLPAVLPHRARWEYLDVNVTRSELIAIVGPMPFLRQLNLTVESTDDFDKDPVAFLDVPLLRNVTLHDETTWHITLPWAQITSLTLYQVYPQECSPLLVQTCNLVHCRLYLLNINHRVVFPHVSLPHLETLTMMAKGRGTYPVLGYLDNFVLPALLTLQIPESFLGPEPIEYLRSFISTSDCQLRDVVITGDEIKFIHSYREAFPSIDKFSFRRYHRDERHLILEGYDEINSNPET